MRDSLVKYPIIQYRRRAVPSDAEAYWVQTLYHAAGLSLVEIATLYHTTPAEIRRIIKCTCRWKHLKRHTLPTLFAWKAYCRGFDTFADIRGAMS